MCVHVCEREGDTHTPFLHSRKYVFPSLVKLKGGTGLLKYPSRIQHFLSFSYTLFFPLCSHRLGNQKIQFSIQYLKKKKPKRENSVDCR